MPFSEIAMDRATAGSLLTLMFRTAAVGPNRFKYIYLDSVTEVNATINHEGRNREKQVDLKVI